MITNTHTHTHTKYMNSNVNVSMQQIHGKSYGMLCVHVRCLPHQLYALNYPFHVSVGVYALRTVDKD